MDENAFDEYLRVSAAFWRNSSIKDTERNDQQYILIEGLVRHSGYMLLNAIIARHLMRIRSLPAAVLLPDRKDQRWENLFRSYGVYKFYYLTDRDSSLAQLIRQIYQAGRLLMKVRNISELLELKHRGVDIGKIVYDTYLRSTGYGTMDRMSGKAFWILVKILGHLDFFADIFSTGSISILVQSERQFVPGAVLCQSALTNGVEILSRGGGPQSFTLQRYFSMDDAYRNAHRHEKWIFDYVMKYYRDEAVKVGGGIIEQRFRGESTANDIPDVVFAFHKGASVTEKVELCRRLDWDESKPIIGVMANMLTDGVFTNRWRIFRDNLVWLRETLQCIREINQVNWVIKAHPSDKKNNVRTPISSECERMAGDCPHIKCLPEDVTTNSLPGIVDVVLTGHGSAGIEYTCFGIPCVIAGESLYSGLGFVKEPQTKAEYFSVLRNIDKLDRPSVEQVERAKVFAYIYLSLSRVTCGLVPAFSVFEDWDDAKLWSEAADLMQGVLPEDDRLGRMMQVQYERGYRHMLNYDWVGLMTETDV